MSPTRYGAIVTVIAIVVLTSALAGCTSPQATQRTVANEAPSSPATQTLLPASPRPRPIHRPKHKRSQHKRKIQSASNIECPASPLRGVYHSYRLHVLGTCRWIRGVVSSVRHEVDGDYHVDIAPDAGYAGLLDPDNYSQQHGSLVTEIMPGQNLSVPFVGEHVGVLGTWVYDTDHGWNEIHPIWAISYGSEKPVQALPPTTPEHEPGSSGSSGSSGGGGGGTSGSNCTPGYSPCLVWHGGADYDCYGGGGNGPYYTAPNVTYRVTGSDPYQLDANHDGYGCSG
jgi:hypothetical protein